MAFDLKNFQDPNLDSDYVSYVVDQQAMDNESFHNRLWNYFRNPLIPASGVAAGSLNEHSRPYFLAQEMGLPARITGIQRAVGGEQLTDLRRKEVVIENDIGWRISTMVDFLFGRPISIRSKAADPAQREVIEQVINTMLEANGGVGLLQEMALFGSIYGFVDVALRIPADWPAYRHSSLTPSQNAGKPASSNEAGRPGTSDNKGSSASDEAGNANEDRSNENVERVLKWARKLRLETVEASRILPILAEDDYRRTRYWIQRFYKHPPRMAASKRPWLRVGKSRAEMNPDLVEVIEIVGPSWWQRYEDRQLVAEGPNALGRVPVVHVQNLASPGTYAGMSDVEPLIPLQDELNTRLSDRAHRVTYQSFKMYLGKGIDDFLERPVGPGQMWATQNMQASIEEFGNDEGSPSEDLHIDHIRAALDKVSGVSPLAAGMVKGNVGNLSSATALKVVLSGLLSRTHRKRLTYGAGLAAIAEMTLDWMDRSGLLKTTPADRQIEIHWPSPLPADDSEQLRNAQIKHQLGVSRDRILAELGYTPAETDEA